MARCNKPHYLFKIIFLLATTSWLHAQVNNFKKWSVINGLAQSNVYAITQDYQGYLWVGTEGGVSVFNGKTFNNYSLKDGLCGNTIRCFLNDTSHNIWIGSENGVTVYDGKTFTSITAKQGFAGNNATAIIQHKEKIIVSTDDGGINIITPLSDKKFNIEHITANEGLADAAIMSMLVDNKQNIWVATFGEGLSVVRFKNGKSEIKNIKGISKLPSNTIFSLNKLSNGHIIAGTEDAGAFTFNPEDFLNDNYKCQKINSSNIIYSTLVTKSNELWLGSLDDGVYTLDAKNNLSHFSVNEGLYGKMITALYEDNEGKIWLGTEGEGLFMLQGKHFSHYTKVNGLSDNKIKAITSQNNELWLATSEAGLMKLQFKGLTPKINYFSKKDGLPDNLTFVTAGEKKYNNNLWLSSMADGIYKYNGKRFENFTEKDGLINKSVYTIYVDSKGIVWCGTADGISKFDGTVFKSISTKQMMMQNEGVKAIIEDKHENIWFATAGGMVRYRAGGALRTFDELEGLKTKDVNALAVHKSGNIIIGTNGGGVYQFDISKSDTTAISQLISENELGTGIVKSLAFVNDSQLIVGTFDGFRTATFNHALKISSIKKYGINDGFIGQECLENSLFVDENKNVWFGTVNGLTKYSPANEVHSTVQPKIKIKDIQLFFKSVNWNDRKIQIENWNNVPASETFNHTENHLTFKFETPTFGSPDKLFYSYILEGEETEWSPPKNSDEITFSGLEPGKYIFKVKSVTENGIWSEPQQFTFTITPPWYKTKIFYGTTFLLLVAFMAGYIKWREKKLIQEKERLEKIVEERTREVVLEKKIVEEQKHIIEAKHKEITDSINYAERIQKNFLATKDTLDKNLNEYFILFKPRNVVSGDFYWAENLSDGNFIIATADSTGHGVPGAIMSLLNTTSLEKAVEHYTQPADILNHTRQTIIERLKRDGSKEGGKDGMDCSLIVLSPPTPEGRVKMLVACANNPVWIVRTQPSPNGDWERFLEIKPDKMPVGKHDKQNIPFTQYEIDLQKGDIIYSLTDGFPDQFGGDKGKKFMAKNLRELLVSNAHLPMQKQYEILEKTFVDWVGTLEQVDDVTVIGIKI